MKELNNQTIISAIITSAVGLLGILVGSTIVVSQRTVQHANQEVIVNLPNDSLNLCQWMQRGPE